MRIDKTHVRWFVFSAALLALGAAVYWYDIHRGPDRLNGARGGSAVGIGFGIAGSAMMLFAGLLSGRKKLRSWRLGLTQGWMRGHLWLGTLALPFIWFHGGFKMGGPLTTALMILLYLIVLSGLLGAFLQHVLPRYLTRNVPNETIYEEIPGVLGALAAEARLTVAVCGPLNGQPLDVWRSAERAALRAQDERALLSRQRFEELAAGIEAAPVSASAGLKDFYLTRVKPFMDGTAAAQSKTLRDAADCATAFETQRTLLRPELHKPLAELQRLCDRRRGLVLQQRLHRWLHGWLLIHVPLSLALLLLGVLHIVMSLRY